MLSPGKIDNVHLYSPNRNIQEVCSPVSFSIVLSSKGIQISDLSLIHKTSSSSHSLYSLLSFWSIFSPSPVLSFHSFVPSPLQDLLEGSPQPCWTSLSNKKKNRCNYHYQGVTFCFFWNIWLNSRRNKVHTLERQWSFYWQVVPLIRGPLSDNSSLRIHKLRKRGDRQPQLYYDT